MNELLKLSDAVTAFLATGAAPVLLPIFLLVARYPNRTCAELAAGHAVGDDVEISAVTRSRQCRTGADQGGSR
jgi:hypothetical protein